jgi:hypothetical protein
VAVLPSFGQRPSLKNTVPEQRGRTRAAAPAGGSQGNAGFIAAQAGAAAPSQGRAGQGGLASGVQRTDAAVWQEADADPRHGGLTRRDGDQRYTDVLVTRDRHMMGKTGTEAKQAHPNAASVNGARQDPLADGPVRPSWMQVNRVHYARRGTTATRYQDNPGPFPATQSTDGRRQPLGTQDGSPWTVVYGGAPGLTHIYGVRGAAGAAGPELGSAGDGPQAVRGGVPHGTHSPTQPDQLMHGRRARAVPQQKRRTGSYPANSKVAGQSYSQTVMPLGGAAHPMPQVSSRRPGMTGRGISRGQ